MGVDLFGMVADDKEDEQLKDEYHQSLDEERGHDPERIDHSVDGMGHDDGGDTRTGGLDPHGEVEILHEPPAEDLGHYYHRAQGIADTRQCGTEEIKIKLGTGEAVDHISDECEQTGDEYSRPGCEFVIEFVDGEHRGQRDGPADVDDEGQLRIGYALVYNVRHVHRESVRNESYTNENDYCAGN